MPCSGAARSVHEEFWSGGKLDDRPALRGVRPLARAPALRASPSPSPCPWPWPGASEGRAAAAACSGQLGP